MTLAFWLHRLGHTTTIVERSDRLRSGGHLIDLRGPSMELAEMCGILDALQERAINFGDSVCVNKHGRKIGEIPSEAFSGELEVSWDDLTHILYDVVKNTIEYRFSSHVVALLDGDDDVHVQFNDGTTGTYDLVIGADGLHSRIRALAFGPEKDLTEQLGAYMGSFLMPYEKPSRHRVFHSAFKRTIILQSAENEHGRSDMARVVLISFPKYIEFNYRDTNQHKQILAENFAHTGWETPRILAELKDASELYFDSYSLVHLPSYSRGRVCLVGDAAYSASPASGMGTTLAITGAYVLAHEIDRSNDHAQAYVRYQNHMKPFVAECQKLAKTNLSAAFPTTTLGHMKWRARLLASTSMPAVGKILNKLMIGRMLNTSSSFDLPHYDN